MQSISNACDAQCDASPHLNVMECNCSICSMKQVIYNLAGACCPQAERILYLRGAQISKHV